MQREKGEGHESGTGAERQREGMAHRARDDGARRHDDRDEHGNGDNSEDDACDVALRVCERQVARLRRCFGTSFRRTLPCCVFAAVGGHLLDLQDDRDDHRSRMGLGPQQVGDLVANAATNRVDIDAIGVRDLLDLLADNLLRLLDDGGVRGERNPSGVDLDGLDGALLARKSDGASDNTLLCELLAIPDNDWVGLSYRPSVDVNDARLHGVAPANPVVDHLERVAIIEDKDVLLVHAKVNRKLGMGAKMLSLTMNGHEITGLGHGEHELELLLGPVARDVHERLVLVVNGASDFGERVDDCLDALLVAGNRRCGDDHGIARVDGKRLMLAVCHSG